MIPTSLMADSEEELKSLLMRMKEESEKAGLKFNIQKTKIMSFGPITSWQIDGGKVEGVTDFIFLDSKITADSDTAMKLEDDYFLEGNLWHMNRVLKSIDITLLTKAYGLSSSQVQM